MSSKIPRLVFSFISSLKQEIDTVTILDGIKKAAENQVEGYKCHFIFAGNAHWYDITLRPVISEGMTKYSINSAMVSVLSSVRSYIITKKEMENHCNGKFEDKNSFHDDLECFFSRLCLGEERNETARTYFFPKLSEKETKLFEANDTDFMRSLSNPRRVYSSLFDRSAAELAHSNRPKIEDDKSFSEKLESKTKYIRGICFRQTFLIRNEEDYDKQPETKIRKMQ